MPNVFISYTHSDSAKVETLVNSLQGAHVEGWLDKADIAGGNSTSVAVRDALNRSSALIVLLSPAALQNQWVQFEIGAAEALGKKIIPIIIAGEHLEEELPEILRNRQWIDARHRGTPEVMQQLKRVLASTLRD